MTDQAGPGPGNQADDSNEEWVTLGSFWSTRHTPGIEDVQETTYVTPPTRIARRTLIIGSAIAIGSVAIGAALVIAAGSGGGGGGGGESQLSAAATLTSTSTTSTSTTTTTAPPTTTTTRASAGSSTPTTKPAVTAAAKPPPVTAAPPTPRATANVAQAVYQPVPLPVGVTASLSSCTWQPAGGGQLQTAGTITSTAATGHTWTVTMHWLQNGRSLNQQSGLIDLLPGQSKSWSLTIAQPNPPADLACSLAVT